MNIITLFLIAPRDNPSWFALVAMSGGFLALGSWVLLFPKELARVKLMQGRITPETMEGFGPRVFHRAIGAALLLGGIWIVLALLVQKSEIERWDPPLCQDTSLLGYFLSAALYLTATKLVFAAWLVKGGDKTQHQVWLWPLIRIVATSSHLKMWCALFIIVGFLGLSGMVVSVIRRCP